MCSSLCSADEIIFIFGKSSHNFAEIIKAALNIDVDRTNRAKASRTLVLLFFGSQPLLAGENPLRHVLS